MQAKTILFDIDGTLADCTHRLHYIAGAHKDYAAFYANVIHDTPIEPVVKLCRNLFLSSTDQIVFVSGRPEATRTATEIWLATHLGDAFNPNHLFMRPDNDYRPDWQIKREILTKLRNMGFDPYLAIDDRPQVIEKCWKAEGVKVLAAEWHGEAQPTAQAPANAPVLILLVGPSCAGKSTYILANFDPHVFYVLSSDVLRQTITGDFKDQTRNDEVFARLHTITKELLWSGNNVVVDATNIRDADRKKFLELAPPNAHIEYHVFNRPMEQKYKDAGWRAELPFDLIAKHENTFNSNLKNILKGDNDPRVTVCDLRSK